MNGGPLMAFFAGAIKGHYLRGCDGFIQKPFGIEELSNKISNNSALLVFALSAKLYESKVKR